jgi:cytoskeletal protein CcmA (bactofilin family)
MFTRKPGTTTSPLGPTLQNGGPPQLPTSRPPQAPLARPAQARRAGATPSIIGSDMSITGNLESAGEIQIDGEVQGDVNAGRIVIGEQANVTGSLIANEVVVRGNVQGSIRGNSVTFQAASRIEGDVFHKTLAIEQGAYFEGKSRRSDDPMSVQRSANGMPPPS